MNEDSCSRLMPNLVLNQLKEPMVVRECIYEWEAMKWTLESWSLNMGDQELPFRKGTKKFSINPVWEGNCTSVKWTFKQFIAALDTERIKDEWFYFDYKHMAEWFSDNPAILNSVNWAKLGFPERGGKDSTLWISSEGAHTPCHSDTYGCNLVAQLYGKKQWILFPHEDDEQLKPTRVPYEESSIFSEINFYSPTEGLRLHGARVVTLQPGEVLFVPASWWHYVETVSPCAISVNTWIPLPSDNVRRVEEALVKLWVSSVCQLSKYSTALLNPSEMDLKNEKPLLEYLKMALSACVSEEPAKKKTCFSTDLNQLDFSATTDGTSKLRASNLNMSPLSILSVDEFATIMQQKRSKFQIINADDTELQLDQEFKICKRLINSVCNKQFVTNLSQQLLNM